MFVFQNMTHNIHISLELPSPFMSTCLQYEFDGNQTTYILSWSYLPLSCRPVYNMSTAGTRLHTY